MNRVEKLPPAFKRYSKMFGVLDFAVFDHATGTEDEILLAIPQALKHARSFDGDRLRSLGCKRIRERSLFGDWYDIDSRNLLKLGDYRMKDGLELKNPRLKELDGVKIVSSASPCPDAGTGGQLAYAFSNPPYGLKGRPSEVQSVFEQIRDFILPPAHPSEIYDWSSPQLPDVSDYFAAGMEWWGVFSSASTFPRLNNSP